MSVCYPGLTSLNCIKSFTLPPYCNVIHVSLAWPPISRRILRMTLCPSPNKNPKHYTKIHLPGFYGAVPLDFHSFTANSTRCAIGVQKHVAMSPCYMFILSGDIWSQGCSMFHQLHIEEFFQFRARLISFTEEP